MYVCAPVYVEHVEVDEGNLREKRLAERGGHTGISLTQGQGGGGVEEGGKMK